MPLEMQPERKLHGAGSTHLEQGIQSSRNARLSEARREHLGSSSNPWVTGQRQVHRIAVVARVGEVRVVEDVEGFSAELQAGAF